MLMAAYVGFAPGTSIFYLVLSVEYSITSKTGCETDVSGVDLLQVLASSYRSPWVMRDARLVSLSFTLRTKLIAHRTSFTTRNKRLPFIGIAASTINSEQEPAHP